jgi:hypothetical protein
MKIEQWYIEIIFVLIHRLFLDVMEGKVHKNQLQEPTLTIWKALDHKLVSTQDTNSSENNLTLIKKLRTLEIVSI